MFFWWDGTAEDAALLAAPPATITSPGGLHAVMQGIGDLGEGARIPQTLHTIDQGITA